MRVTIDGSRIRSESDLHDVLAGRLDFGPYYGRNLDALWDRLSRDVERPVEIVWENVRASRANLGAGTFDAIASVLTRAMAEDESLGREDRLTVRFVE